MVFFAGLAASYRQPVAQPDLAISLPPGGQERFYASEGYDGGSNVLRMIGYFSLTGLLRVHTLVGDYGGALASLAVVHPFQRSNLFTPKIAGALLRAPTSALCARLPGSMQDSTRIIQGLYKVKYGEGVELHSLAKVYVFA